MLQQSTICMAHVIDYMHNSRSRLDRSVELPVNTNASIKIIMNSGHVNGPALLCSSLCSCSCGLLFTLHLPQLLVSYLAHIRMQKWSGAPSSLKYLAMCPKTMNVQSNCRMIISSHQNEIVTYRVRESWDVDRTMCRVCARLAIRWESNDWKYHFNWINMVCHVTCSLPPSPSI